MAETEHPSEDVPVGEAAVEVKIPLCTMAPLPSTGAVAEIPPPSSSTLAMVLSPPEAGAPGPSQSTGAELDEELQRLLVPLYQEAGEDDDPEVEEKVNDPMKTHGSVKISMRRNYSQEEDVALCHAWMNMLLDASNDMDQSKDKF